MKHVKWLWILPFALVVTYPFEISQWEWWVLLLTAAFLRTADLMASVDEERGDAGT